MGKEKKNSNTVQVYAMVSEETRTALLAEAEKMADSLGVRVTTSDIVRMAVNDYLAAKNPQKAEA